MLIKSLQFESFMVSISNLILKCLDGPHSLFSYVWKYCDEIYSLQPRTTAFRCLERRIEAKSTSTLSATMYIGTESPMASDEVVGSHFAKRGMWHAPNFAFFLHIDFSELSHP
jgi:hypothetical protein